MINSSTRPAPSGRRTSRRRHPKSQAAFLYVAVLFTSVIVMVVVAAALTISTSRVRSQIDHGNRAQAIRLAESEIHRQVAVIDGDLDWRSTHTNGEWSDWQSLSIDGTKPFQDATLRHRFYDQDGSLSDDLFDAAELTVQARVGRSAAAIAVEIEPAPQPLELLRYAVTATDDLEIEGGTLATSWPVQVGDDCKTNSTGLLTTPRLDCSGRIEFPVRGDLATADVEPPEQDVVERYVQLGTEIEASSLPRYDLSYWIHRRVISASENPFGDVDANGIYWIDAEGGSVIISDSHLKATLAIKNAARVYVAGSFVWHYPTQADVILATHARVDFVNLDPVLDETDEGTHFNPPTTPYRNGSGNKTLTDRFPTELRGIIYSSGRVEFDTMEGDRRLQIHGAVIGRDVAIDGHVSVMPLPEVLQNPPSGLADPSPVRFGRGTMRRVASP